MNIHRNSLTAKKQLKVGGRHNRILQIHHIANHPLTDREVKKLCHFDDLNDVRPRITELLSYPYERLVECGDVKDFKTKKMVRTTRLVRPGESKQRELF